MKAKNWLHAVHGSPQAKAPDIARIAEMPIPGSNLLERIRQKTRRTLSESLAKRLCPCRPATPVVSFTFDDFPKNSVTVGASILQAFDVRATYYTAFGLMGQHAPTGQMFDRYDLDALQAFGHELGCHTFAHNHAWDTPTKTFSASVEANRRALMVMLPGATFATLSYPISAPKPSIKKAAGRRFRACRAGGQAANVGIADLNSLKSFFLERSREDASKIRRLIDATCQSNGWLIFSTHDVSSSPTRYGCTPEFFRQVVQWTVASGARILPVNAALDEIGVQSM